MDKSKFFFNGIVVMLFIIGVFTLYDEVMLVVPREPLTADSSRKELEQARLSFPRNVTPVTAWEVVQKISSAKKPTLLYIYTSWCGYCKMQTPEIERIIKNSAGKINMVAVSLDNDPQALSDQVRNAHHPMDFGNFIVLPDDHKRLRQGLLSLGINFRNAFPFTVVLDAQGKTVLHGLSGYRDYDTLNNAVVQAVRLSSAR